MQLTNLFHFKVPGGSVEDSFILNGIMINKDVTHPAMRRQILQPRIILLDCPLEYKKGESQVNYLCRVLYNTQIEGNA